MRRHKKLALGIGFVAPILISARQVCGSDFHTAAHNRLIMHLDHYYLSCGDYPKELYELNVGGCEAWQKQALGEINLLDENGVEWIYHYPSRSTQGKAIFDLFSSGYSEQYMRN
jgi:hypothetical protein